LDSSYLHSQHTTPPCPAQAPRPFRQGQTFSVSPAVVLKVYIRTQYRQVSETKKKPAFHAGFFHLLCSAYLRFAAAAATAYPPPLCRHVRRRPLFWRASLTVSARPSISFPLQPAMAAWASWSEPISTKPKPFERPVSRS